MELQHVTVIGCGLLGSSVALAIKSRNRKVHIAGVGRRRSSLQEALSAGAIDTAHLDAAETAGKSNMVILATPVGAFEKHLRAIKPVLRRGAVVTDVGSTKARVVAMGERVLGKGGPFVGSHPMSGGEQKGPSHARADLFAGATCIVTPTRHTPAARLRRVQQFWKSLGMRVVCMSPAAHDKAVARVSHLPHVVAGLLMLQPRDADLEIAGPGLRDTTRLASGDPEMWRDILITNRRAILEAMDAFDDRLCQLRDLLEMADAPGIEKFLAQAKKRRDDTIAG